MNNCNCINNSNVSIMQGDAYDIKFNITDNSGVAITSESVHDVEIMIGQTVKSYASGEITYDGGYWLFPITQEESFTLISVPQYCQIRVKFLNGDVAGRKLGKISITESRSKEVL